MRFSDIPLGSDFRFGRYGDNLSRGIEWIKVSESHLITNHFQSFSCRPMFLCEDGKPNYYPESDLHAFLNDKELFLKDFLDNELAVMEKFSIEVAAPKGSVRKYGKCTTIETLVAIPSAQELGFSCSTTPEGAPLLGVHLIRGCMWLRTPAGRKSFVCTDSQGGVRARQSTAWYNIRPMISISPNALFTCDEDGFFVLSDFDVCLNLNAALFDDVGELLS